MQQRTTKIDSSGRLTSDQLFGADDVPPVCGGYLPDGLRAALAERDRVRYVTCPSMHTPCPALDEQTGECLAGVCVVVRKQGSGSRQ